MAIRPRAFAYPIMLAVALAVATACDNPTRPSSAQESRVYAKSISIGGLKALEHPGDVVQLSATVTFSDGSTSTVTTEVTWSSSDTRVVTLQPAGLLTATGYGTTQVQATYKNLVSAKGDARVLPAGMFFVRGYVMEEGPFAVPEAVVSVTLPDGTSFRTTSGADGGYKLPGQGDVVLRAEKDGLSTQERRLFVDRDVDVQFLLMSRLRGLGDITGPYTLTFTASGSCTLPAEVMRRQYAAKIFAPDKLWVELSGAADMEAWGWAGFTGTRTGDTVRFEITDSYAFDAVFIERLDPDHNFAFSGVATGTIGEGSIVTTFNGLVQLRSYQGFPSKVFAECRATDHRLEFVR